MRNIRIFTTLLALILALSACESLWGANSASAIDEIKSVDAKILPDGSLAIITLHFSGKSINAPIKWTVDIKDARQKILMSFEGDDRLVDPSFERKLLNGCKGYEDCKRLWYYDDFLLNIKAMCGRLGPEPPVPPENSTNLRLSHKLENEFLVKRGLSREQRKKVIQKIDDQISDGTFSVCWTWKNLKLDTEYIYVPSLGYFVPYWRKNS